MHSLYYEKKLFSLLSLINTFGFAQTQTPYLIANIDNNRLNLLIFFNVCFFIFYTLSYFFVVL
jgi:hypothetical protein